MDTVRFRLNFVSKLAVVALLLAAVVPAAHAAGLVSTCDEASLTSALAGGGLVTFTCSGEITLTQALVITSNTSLDGTGQHVTLDANGGSAVIVNGNATLLINNLTIVNGQQYGGLLNTGTAIVTNSTFRGNSGGAIQNLGPLTVTNSTFAGNDYGLWNIAGTVTISSSTFSGNSSGALWINDGSTVTVASTILAGNGGECTDNAATDAGYNLDDDGSCGFTSTGSLSNNQSANLGSLSDNGGSAQTILLQSGSSAIGVIPAGTNGCATTIAGDQRGVARPGSLNGNCSMGAYEYVPAPNYTISNCTDIPTIQKDIQAGGRIVFQCSGDIKLTGWLNINANTAIDATGYNVTLDGQQQFPVLLNGSSVLILNNLTIANGSGATGGGIANNGTLVVTNVTFSGNHASSAELFWGGGIYNTGTLIVSNSSFSGNYAGVGSGLYNIGTLTVTYSTFSGNSGAALANAGSASLENTILANNTGGDCDNRGGSFTDAGYNLDDDGSCGFTSGHHSFSNNQNANLGALSSNGGSTQTLPLLYPSAAIDAIPLGTNGCGLSADQRGVPRPQGAACDIGAYEANQIPVAFATSPANLSYTVGGRKYTAAAAPSLVVGGQYQISTASPQPGSPGTEYVWQSWSDDGAQSHTITVPATPASYTAVFQTQYLLTTAANPTVGGAVNVSTASPTNDGYYPANSNVSITALPNTGYQFASWSGNVSSTTTASTTVTMSEPETVTASFAQPVQVTVGTNPSGLSFSVDSTVYSSPQTLTWTLGSLHTIATASPQTFGGLQYGFAGWSDAGAMSHQVSASSGTTSYTAKFNSFSITPTPGAETILRGNIAAFILNLKSVNGFSGRVKLSCSGGPAGSYCVNFPMTVGLNGTAKAVSGIFFPKNAKQGTYVVTFTGISGTLTNTATAKFTVK